MRASLHLLSQFSRLAALSAQRSRPSRLLAIRAMAAPADPVPGCLPGRRDMYDGIILDAEGLPDTAAAFSAALASSEPSWRAAGVKGVWLKIPAARAHLIGHAVDAGFAFHHAEPEYLMLTRWLAPTENKLPPNASHQVGVGAFVFDRASRKVLVVQERHGPLRGAGVWKMPTGLVQAGEDITEAALREVEEETGVAVEFKAVLAMRQAHGIHAGGKSDLFFLVAAEPTAPAGAAPLRPQEDEVEAAAWISLEEYTAIDFHRQRPLLRKLMERCAAWAAGAYPGLAGCKLAAGFSERQDLLMFGESAEEAASAAENEDAWIGLS